MDQKTCVVTLFDSNYVDQAAVMLQSFHDNYLNPETVDVVCVMPKEDIEKGRELVHWINTPKLNIKFREPVAPKNLEIEKIESGHWGTNTSWYRLFLGSTLYDYSRAIFLDADMMAISDVQPILDFPMYGKFMACMDITDDDAYRGMDNLANFHTGMFIADLVWWRDSKVEERFEAHMLQNPPSPYIEEELFNLYMRESWYPLPVVFNFYYFYRDDDGDCIWDEPLLPAHYKKAIMVHFFGRAKPWNYRQRKGDRDGSKLGVRWRRLKRKLIRD